MLYAVVKQMMLMDDFKQLPFHSFPFFIKMNCEILKRKGSKYYIKSRFLEHSKAYIYVVNCEKRMKHKLDSRRGLVPKNIHSWHRKEKILELKREAFTNGPET